MDLPLLPDINECLRNPCKNLSPCTNSPGSYSCACSPQWSGQNCDIGKKIHKLYHASTKTCEL